MSICPKCGETHNEKNNAREYLLENRRGRVGSKELCEFCD